MKTDILIIGGGPAGAAAALALRGSGREVTLIDIGHEPGPHDLTCKTFRSALAEPGFLGHENEYMQAMGGEQLMPKLRAPLQRYVMAQPDLSPLQGKGFNAAVSHALGGLANVWGAQMLRYGPADLEGFTLSPADLAPHYEALQAEIGLTGRDDDLSRFYGPAQGLQPPHPLGGNARDLLSRYKMMRRVLNPMGVYIGQPRTAILSQPHNGRPAHVYDDMEFFRPQTASIYSPVFTLRRLEQEGALHLLRGQQALALKAGPEGVEVTCRDVLTGAQHQISARKVVLAAGALNSARLVLASRGDTTTQLGLLDNRLSYIPLLNPLRLGATQPEDSTYLQLNLCYERAGKLAAMGSFYAVRGLPQTDFISAVPLDVPDAVRLLPHILPALLVLHLWHPAEQAVAHVQYDGHKLVVTGHEALDGRIERSLVFKLALLGFLASPWQVQYPPLGNSFHYSGTLPMRPNPGPYETGPDGQLGDMPNVYVADGSVFPRLSAKNLSFTLMANAHRIGTRLREAA